jgi:hypothetical protein
LRDTQRHRFHDAEQPIQDSPFKERVMNEVMRNSVDVPGYAHGVDKPHAHQNPPGRIRKHKEKCEHVDEMKGSAKNTDRIPFGIGKNFHFSFCRSVPIASLARNKLKAMPYLRSSLTSLLACCVLG